MLYYTYACYNIAAHRGRSGVCDSKIYLCISCGLMFPLVRRRWHSPCHCRFFSHCLFLAPSTPHLPRHVAEGVLLHHRWWFFNTIFKNRMLLCGSSTNSVFLCIHRKRTCLEPRSLYELCVLVRRKNKVRCNFSNSLALGIYK